MDGWIVRVRVPKRQTVTHRSRWPVSSTTGKPLVFCAAKQANKQHQERPNSVGGARAVSDTFTCMYSTFPPTTTTKQLRRFPISALAGDHDTSCLPHPATPAQPNPTQHQCKSKPSNSANYWSCNRIRNSRRGEVRAGVVDLHRVRANAMEADAAVVCGGTLDDPHGTRLAAHG